MERNVIRQNRVVRAGLGYTIGNYMIKGLTFFSIPIFSRLMTPADYGIYNTYIAYESILSICLGLALSTCQKSAKYKFDNQYNEFVSSCLTLTLCSTFVWLTIGNIFFAPIRAIIGTTRTVLNLLILHSAGSAVLSIFNVYLSITYSYKQYLSVAAFNAIGNIGLSVILILTFYKGDRATGRIIGTAVPILLLLAFIVFFFWKKADPRINLKKTKKYWKYALGYSVPIIPHGLSQVILNQVDRLMINSICGSTQAGIYSFAYNIYSIISVTTASLDSVWSPWFFEKATSSQTEQIRKRASQYAVVILFLVSSVMLISPEIVKILGTAQYSGAEYCVIPILVGGYFSFLYTIPVQVQYYYEKTKWIALMTVFAAVLNMVLNAIFIPLYGYIAAAYTTAVTYAVYFSLHAIVSSNISKCEYFNYPMLLTFGAVCIGIAALSIFLLPQPLLRWGFALAIATGVVLCLGKQLFANK